MFCAGETARTALTTTYAWTIYDGGKDPMCGIEFITTWQTTATNETITIPTTNTGKGYSYDVDWGDSAASTAQTGNATHTYATAGTYTVKITGVFSRILFNNTGDKAKIKTIEQWGTNAWTSMKSAFSGCSNLTSTAIDAPDLSAVTDMSYMFWGASAFNQDISTWNTAAVTNMVGMFLGATVFNQDISTWNTASVTDMYGMFWAATAFNQNLGSWNVANVTNFAFMLTGVTLSETNYDALLIGWDAQNLQPSLSFHAGNAKYCSDTAQAARANIIASDSWAISDGGLGASCTILGIEDNTLKNSISFYPNPVNNILHIQSSHPLQNVSIYNLLGKQVKSIDKNFNKINVKSLNSGIYFVKTITKEGKNILKLVKE